MEEATSKIHGTNAEATNITEVHQKEEEGDGLSAVF